MSENKRMAQRFGDMIAISDMKNTGPMHIKDNIRRGLVKIYLDDREAMLEAMAQLHCRHVDFGTYGCAVAKNGFYIDYCLEPEINRLNEVEGIKTVGCCCGHGRQEGYVQVAPEWIPKMIELGYEQISPEDGNGYLCFKPKTSLPKPSTVLAPVDKSQIEKLKESIEYLEDENLMLRKEKESDE